MRVNNLIAEPHKSLHDGYLFRYERYGTEKLLGKTRTLKGEKKNGEIFELELSLSKLPVKNYFIAVVKAV